MKLSMALREARLSKAFHALCNEVGDDDLGVHAALYWYCSDNHKGQACPLYACLSQSQYTPGVLERECPEEYRWMYETFDVALNGNRGQYDED